MKTKTSIAGNRGFTLLELIVVLFIAGLSMSIVVFSASRLHEKTIFNEEARKIYQAAKRARETSLLKRLDVSLRVREDGTGYLLEYGGGIPTDEYQVNGKFVVSGKDVIFFPKGNTSGGSITIENNKGQGYVIEVDQISGKPSIKRF